MQTPNDGGAGGSGPPTATETGTNPSAATLGTQVKDAASELAQEVKTEASNLVERVEETAKTKIEAGKDSAADEMQAVADALKKTAQSTTDQAWISELAQQGAQELTGLAETLRGNNLDGLLGKLGDLARRQPALFFGAAVVAGFAGARLGKAAVSEVANDAAPESGRIGHGSR